MSKLSNYVDTLIDLARQQGLSSTNDIVYRLAPEVVVILSDNEPTDHVFPLDGVWVVTDIDAQDYKTVYKRVNKVASNGKQFTWELVLEYDDFVAIQKWDQSDLPEPVILSAKGGQLEAPLLPRIVNAFVANEVIPRSYADAIKSQLSSGFSVMLSNLNARTTANTGRVNTLNETVRLLSAKVDEAINSSAIRGMVTIQEDPSPLWAFTHEFGEGKGFCFCTDLSGEIVWPEKVYTDPSAPETLLVEFLEPVSGFGLMVYVPISTP